MCIRDRDDAGLAVVPIEDRDQLAVQMPAADHSVDEVGPIEGSDQHHRILEAELADDVATDPLGGGGGEGVERHAGEILAEPPELPVLGTEIVAPLADAM